MPYLSREHREYIDEIADFEDLGMRLSSAGELNYSITKLVKGFLSPLLPSQTPHYEDYNTVIGALECVKQELYRHVVGPYEDIKIRDNGDVY